MSNGKRKKILIVDDEKNFTFMIKLNLEITGKYQVKEENKSTQALASTLAYRPDLLILDFYMPVWK